MLHLIFPTFFTLVIVDNSCPLVAFEKIGCFKDNHIVSARPLPEYLTNDRDPKISTFSGQRIDWRNWDVYVPDFACRCALKAKEKNYTFFGVQFYGEQDVLFLFFIIQDQQSRMNSKKSGKKTSMLFYTEHLLVAISPLSRRDQ